MARIRTSPNQLKDPPMGPLALLGVLMAAAPVLAAGAGLVLLIASALLDAPMDLEVWTGIALGGVCIATLLIPAVIFLMALLHSAWRGAGSAFAAIGVFYGLGGVLCAFWALAGGVEAYRLHVTGTVGWRDLAPFAVATGGTVYCFFVALVMGVRGWQLVRFWNWSYHVRLDQIRERAEQRDSDETKNPYS